MPWENKNPEDQNLEELRKSFSLENITNSDVLLSAPSVDEIEQGQFRLVYVGTEAKVYLYTKYGNNLYKTEMSIA